MKNENIIKTRIASNDGYHSELCKQTLAGQLAAPMALGALGRGEIWALNRSIREYGKMPTCNNSQIPGDTRYKR